MSIRVAAKKHIFAEKVHFADIKAGATLAGVLARAPVVPDGFHAGGRICIDGHEIPRHNWRLVRPKDCTTVTLHAPPRDGGGGGDGGKNPLATVVQLAAIAGGLLVSGGALVSVLGPAFAAGSLGAGAAAAAVGITGSLVSSALSPPPSQVGVNAGSTLADEPTLEARGQGVASLSGNVVRAGAPMPRVLGTHRVFPVGLCFPLVEPIGDDEYAEAVFGLDGPHALNDIRIGNVPVADLDEVEIASFDARDGTSKPTLIQRHGTTAQVGLEVSRHLIDPEAGTQLADQVIPANSLPQWHSLRARVDPDEIWINLSWPRGLFSSSAIGTAQSVPVRVRFRKVGAGSWRNAPEVHFKTKRTQGFQRLIKLMFMATPVASQTPLTEDAPDAVMIVVPGQSVAPATTGWTADTIFDANTGGAHFMDSANHLTTDVQNVRMFGDRVEFYLPASDKGEYEIEVIYGHPYRDSSLVHSTYALAGTVRDLFAYYTSGTERVYYDLTNYTYDLVVPRLMSIWNESPVPTRDFAFVMVRIHNRQLGDLSILASGYVPTWDGANWQTIATSANPADHFRDALAGARLADPVPVELMDDTGIIAWRTDCVANSYQVNAVVEGGSSWDAAQLCASAGYARLRASEKFGVMRDYDRSGLSPVQVFGPRNMADFRWEKAFTRRPDGLRVSYNDASANYEPGELVVLDPDETSGGTRLEAVSYAGLVTQAEVQKRAAFDIAQSKQRSTFYYGTVGAEAIVCERGDLVALQHDIISRQAGYARIKSVATDGGAPELVTALTLDASVVADLVGFFDNTGDEYFFDNTGVEAFFTAPRMGVLIRGAAGTMFVKEVTAASAEPTVLTFVTPFEDASAEIIVGGLVVTGELGAEYIRAIVASIRFRDGMSAELMFVDEAQGLLPRTLLATASVSISISVVGAAGAVLAAAAAVTVVITTAGVVERVISAGGATSIALTVSAVGRARRQGMAAVTISINATAGSVGEYSSAFSTAYSGGVGNATGKDFDSGFSTAFKSST